MELKCKINGEEVTLRAEPTARLRDVLYRAGYRSVRDSDDAEGFAGSDTIVFNGKLKYANFILFYQAEGAEIRTAESLLNGRELNNVQKAMVAAGIVQSAYNAPAAALILTWLLDRSRTPPAKRARMLTSIFIRDAGYEHYYLAVKLAASCGSGRVCSEIAPSFRPLTLRSSASPAARSTAQRWSPASRCLSRTRCPRMHGACMCCAAPLPAPTSSPSTRARRRSCPASPPSLPRTIRRRRTICRPVRAIPSRPRTTAGSSTGRSATSATASRASSPARRRSPIKAAALIKVEYEPQGAVYTVEEAMAEGAPLVHNGEVIYNAGAPADLAEYNKLAGDEREGKVVYQFPLGADIHRNIAASNRGGIGDMEKGFAEADAIVEQTYQTSQIQHTPLEPHVCYAHIEGGRLVLNCATQVPYHVRRIVSWVCGIPENKIHVIKERVGGGYGSKQDILVEELTGYAAWITKKPVYYRNTRAEEFYANSTRHPMRVHVKMGGKKDGTITALFMEVVPTPARSATTA